MSLSGNAIAVIGAVGVLAGATTVAIPAAALGAALGGLGALANTPYGSAALQNLQKYLGDVLSDSSGIPQDSNLNGTYDALGNLITDLQSSFNTAEVTISPLILDLDGDGVETVSKSAGLHFDHDGNHFAETTGWTGKDDGLLVLDRNANGQIDNGGELFGNNTQLVNGNKAANGFAALAELDSNGNGKIDANDAAFNQLRVWKDSDGNGVTSDGELLTLDAAGVQSLSTAYVSQSQTDAQGNQHLQVGQYTRTDGSTQAMDDVWFATDAARSIDQNLVVVSDAIAVLPELQGFGNVHSLHQAMARNTNGHLQNLVQNFVDATDSTTRHAVFQEILFAWTGSDQYSATSRGESIDDGRKLYTLEAFLGENFVQGSGVNAGANEPGPNAAVQLISAYNNLSRTLYGQLISQTDRIHSLYDNIGLVWNAAAGTFDLDLTDVVSSLQSAYVVNADTGLDLMHDFGVSLVSGGSFGNDVLRKLSEIGNVLGQGFEFYLGTISCNQIIGGAGNDNVSGLAGISNSIQGLDGNDMIDGADKDDVLNGGAGNDELLGGAGNDTYVFNVGDGIDTILDRDSISGNRDKLQLGAGITADGVQVDRSGDHLILSFNASDKVTLQNYFYSSNNRIETIAFADGTTWDHTTVGSKLVYNGTANADILNGVLGMTNRINGLDGNDTINGADKADVLSGGTGNDSLLGGTGNDTYVFNLGDGADIISDLDSTSGNSDKLQFGAGITADSIQMGRIGNDLILSVNASDKVTLQNYFLSNSSYRIEAIAFADGTTWDYTTVANKQVYNGTANADTLSGVSGVTNRINGLGGNDTINGADKDDVLNGGTGNDSLLGGTGNDTYVFNLGDGVDTIIDSDSTSSNSDKLQFGAGITAETIQMGRSGDDLILSVNASDKVTLKNYFSSSSSYRVEAITFADGTTWDYTTVANKLVYNGTANADTLSGVSGVTNRINGLGGNDTINGADKADVLSGGAGNDSLTGGTGNDTYVFNLGDGEDTISDTDTTSGNSDKLQFGAGITAESIQMGRSGDNLILSVNASDKVTLKNYFFGNYNKIESIAFADGSAGDYTTVGNKQLDYNGTANADTLSGVAGVTNRINGLGGNDKINGAAKDDVLSGGAGNDTLTGGTGNDTYIFNLGDGIDTISDSDTTSGNNDKLQFGAGITANGVQLDRNGSDLILSVNASDKVTLQNYFYANSPSLRIETIAFADGTIWDYTTIGNKLVYNGTANADFMYGASGVTNRINGLGGNDTISAINAEKDDVLSGGTGNDTLYGGSGNDTYIFNLGDGIDTISDSDTTSGNNDKLQFGAGITADAIQLSRISNDLILSVNANDKVTLKDYFSSNSSNRIETIAFANGTVWDYTTVGNKLVYNGTANAETLTGASGVTNRINGLGGNDTINGADKDDVLSGDAGSDLLSGGSGNDIFKFISPDQGTDSISDFTSGADVIQIVGSNFGLQPGVGVSLLTGTATPSASGTTPQFLYNTTTGALYFDQDGEGSAYNTLSIVTLTGQKNLAATDIVVV